jgi:hypothetical protein
MMPQTTQPKVQQPTQCKSAPDITGQVGAFADVAIGKLTVSLNLISINFPQAGGSYLSQGAGIGLKGFRTFGVPLSVGVDRTSSNGGLSFESTSWQASSDNMSVSQDDGLSFSLGLGIGFTVSHLENLLNLIIPCAG